VAFKTSAAPSPINTWTKGSFLGFRRAKGGSGFVAAFKLDTGENTSKLFSDPINLKEINELRLACGLPAAGQSEDLLLPEIGDDDMFGYHAPIEIYVKANGKFLNSVRFRPVQSGATSPNPTSPGSEDDLPF
jgi:hypothetical protein